MQSGFLALVVLFGSPVAFEETVDEATRAWRQGDYVAAAEAFQSALREPGVKLTAHTRSQLQLRLGESMLRAGDAMGALKAYRAYLRRFRSRSVTKHDTARRIEELVARLGNLPAIVELARCPVHGCEALAISPDATRTGWLVRTPRTHTYTVHDGTRSKPVTCKGDPSASVFSVLFLPHDRGVRRIYECATLGGGNDLFAEGNAFARAPEDEGEPTCVDVGVHTRRLHPALR